MDDPVVASLPIYLSTALLPNLQLYQYPLLQRPLQVPPSAKLAGKKINARFKPETDIIEIHVPFDTREDVWNKKQSREYGQYRHEEDGHKTTSKEEKRLNDLRLKSERIREGAAYMVGVVRDNQLHLHRISATYKFRPNLAYVDLHSQKTKRRRGEEEGTFSDEAEEQEEQEAQPKKSKALGEAKEVMVSARKTGESKFPTGMSDMRRELLRNLRAEELESWVSLKYQDETGSHSLFEGLMAKTDTHLECTSSMAGMLHRAFDQTASMQ